MVVRIPVEDTVEDSVEDTVEETVEETVEDTVEDTGSTYSKRWVLFGSSCPKAEIVFFCQVGVLYTVIVVSI